MDLIQQLVILLFISTIIYTIDVKQYYFPVPVVLVLIGMGLSFLPLFTGFSTSKDILYEVFIPGLLFVSAYQYSAKAFKKNAGLIITLSTLGMVATVFLLGIAIYYTTALFQPFSWSISLLLAAILAPTDPISVVSILKNSTGSRDIPDVLEGESMLNDGTSVVMFTVFLSMVESGSKFSALNFIQNFAFVAFGGVLVGLVFGWILSQAVHITAHREYQVMLSVLIAYGSFMLAEYFGFSGVLATVVSGMILSNTFSKKDKEAPFRDALGGFWNVINPILSSILFLFIGIQAMAYIDFTYWQLAFIVFVLSIIARFLVLVLTLFSVPKWRAKFEHIRSGIVMLSWAGIKGSMSVVLILWTIDSSVGDNATLVSLAFASILISFTIQSIGIYPLTQIMHHSKKS
ncbi:cation:proton antiporter [Marinilactibacillus kalidii]|uniref:cation:proton antiporter n=1 Tax=Marinilactibacillus kalidii TaxID=2820274 RepID=UPI001ABE5128|nr:sodium:proton antiporter [Marinilactibacillus kalidii]